MNSQPLISVIIPVYNGERTVGEAIRSVLRQTHDHFELIVVDDGSQDATRKVVDGFSDLRLRRLTRAHAGPSAARNLGLCQAQGSYVSFLDADDLWTEDKLSRQLEALEAHPDAAMAYSWTDYVDAHGRFLFPGSHRSANGRCLQEFLDQPFIINGSNVLAKTEILRAAGGFDESLFCGEDWDLLLRMIAAYPVAAVPSVQVLYRHSRHSWSSQIDRMERDGNTVIQNFFGRLPVASQGIRAHVKAYLYSGLAMKCLQWPVSPRCLGKALGYLWTSARSEPSFLRTLMTLGVTLRVWVCNARLRMAERFEPHAS